MDDTKHIRQTMNVIFMEEGTISPDKMPDTLEFDLSDNSPMPINANHLHASFATNSHPGPNVASVDKIPFPFPPVAHCMGAGSTVPVRTSRCRFPLNAVLHTGNLSRCKSIHGKARCKALEGKTVLQALGMHYFVGGKYKQYTCSDLHYDCDKECLLVSSPAGVLPDNPHVNATFSTTPLEPVDELKCGMPDLEEHEWFDGDAARAITYHADIDPLIEGETWGVQLSVNGVLESYALQPDRTPHEWYSDELVCQDTFLLSSKDTPFVTHKSLKQLDQCPYKQECLEAIANEYGNFDKRCMWKCVRQPDGAALHRMMLLGKIKYKPCGAKEKIKFRAVLMGNDFVKGRDCDFHTFAPNASIATARCVIYDAVAKRKCLKSCDVRQAYTIGQADRRTFVQCPPGRRRSYDADGSPLVYEITGNCYGSPGAPKRWNIAIHNALIELTYVQSTVDPCLYSKLGNHPLVYTDDFLSSYPDTPAGRALYDELVNMLTTKFELGDDGYQDCRDFIGMHLDFNKDRTAVVITQPLKISELLEDNDMNMCRPAYTPGVPNTLVCTRDCPSPTDTKQLEFMRSKPYKRRIGQLLWIARSSRPDIAYQVNALARVAHNPAKRTGMLVHISFDTCHTLVTWELYTALQKHCLQVPRFGLMLLGLLTMATGMTIMPPHQDPVSAQTQMGQIYWCSTAQNNQQLH